MAFYFEYAYCISTVCTKGRGYGDTETALKQLRLLAAASKEGAVFSNFSFERTLYSPEVQAGVHDLTRAINLTRIHSENRYQ